MNPLECLLKNRRRDDMRWRSSWSYAFSGFSPRIRKLAYQLVWPRRFKHMRYLASGITLSPGTDQRWNILQNHLLLAESRTLSQLIPKLDSPVSIIATGPSALDYSWDRLRDGGRFLIAVNGAPTMLREVGIVPDLLVVTDREFALTGAHHLEQAPKVPLVIEWLAAAALASTAPDVLTDRPFAIIERVNMWHGLPVLEAGVLKLLNEGSEMPFVLPVSPDRKCRVGWSYRPELGFFPGRTVVFAALQVAIGRGAVDVEIIGMDLGGGRAYPADHSARPSQLAEHYESYILPSFQTMAQALEGSGISVQNISPVCPLPAHLFHTRLA